MRLIRKQTYLTEAVETLLKRAREHWGVSEAELIRQALASHLMAQEVAQDPMDQIIRLVSEGPVDVAVRHDHYWVGAEDGLRDARPSRTSGRLTSRITGCRGPTGPVFWCAAAPPA